MFSGNRQSTTILSILFAIITTFFLSIALNNSIIVGTHLALAQQQVSIVSGASTLADKAYSPNPINVKVGDTVTWTNDDG
jgi:plastocyanin